MINPDNNDFIEDEPLSASMQDKEQVVRRRVRQGARKGSTAAKDTWAQTKAKAGNARERTEFFLRENPVPTILGALALGLAIGFAIRYASTSAEKKEFEVKSPFGNLNWSLFSLPFLWPFFRSVREKYEDSTETVKSGIDRLRKVDVDDYTHPIRKRWRTWTH